MILANDLQDVAEDTCQWIINDAEADFKLKGYYTQNLAGNKIFRTKNYAQSYLETFLSFSL